MFKFESLRSYQLRHLKVANYFLVFVATSLHRVCKSVSGPIFGFCSEHLSVAFRGIEFIRSQTRQNSTTSTIAEANIDITQSIFVRSRQRSTTYRLKRSRNVALFPCEVNSSRLQ